MRSFNKNNVKVLMCGNHPFNNGGMTAVITQIKKKNWKKEGIQLDFVATFKPGSLLFKSFFFGVAFIRILIKFIIDKPHIVHMHMSYKGSFSRAYLIHKLCIKFGVKDIIHLHGSEFEKWYGTVEKKKKEKIKELLKECSCFIVLGEKWKKIISTIEPMARTVILTNSVNIPMTTAKWDDDCCEFLYLGVLIPRKGVEDLLMAIRKVQDMNINKKVHFTIAGTGESEKGLKMMAKELGIETSVNFVGWITGTEKDKLLNNSQVMILPSYNEGLPISILEAASRGIPIISTDVGDISAVVKNDVTGYLFEPGDIDAMTRLIIKVLNKDTYTGLSQNIKQLAVSEFSEEIFYANLLDIYKSVVG